jgi:hypothetical protein
MMPNRGPQGDPQNSRSGSCRRCGGPIVGRRSDALFCSRQCKKRAARQRVKDEIASVEQPEEFEVPVREVILASRDERIWRRIG